MKINKRETWLSFPIFYKGRMVYLKYFSAFTILSAICLHALNIHPLNVIVHMIGACTWSVVGFAWKENSIILNFLPQVFILGGGLVYTYFMTVPA